MSPAHYEHWSTGKPSDSEFVQAGEAPHRCQRLADMVSSFEREPNGRLRITLLSGTLRVGIMADNKNMACGPEGCTPAGNASSSSVPKELMVFSDFICPWCLIGKSRLDEALSQVPDHSLTVRWMPFELNPAMPPEGMDRRAYRSAKFGSWERSMALDAQVEQAARAEGLAFRHDLIQRTPNTRSAHRLTWLAGEHQLQDRVAQAILRAYFLEGRDIGQVEVLADVASEQGMRREEALQWLQSEAGQQEVLQETNLGRQLGITGVPAVVADGEFLFSGAHEPQEIATALFGGSKGLVQ